ncbi:transposase [Yersinia pseudotuberculosis]|nr:transposase [Yersinia pseudotuberculosis]PSH33200.1 transposase [Yersinia pseudotuberculosis]PSH38267.1 transposase [Yersinia pseudotuberculosis]CNC19622.1 putative transposase [Yersinia pseudotuberculosis]
MSIAKINQSIKALLRKKLTRTKLIPVFYEDEVDIDLNLNPKIGADWCMKGQQKRIATHRGRIKNTILQEQSIR